MKHCSIYENTYENLKPSGFEITSRKTVLWAFLDARYVRKSGQKAILVEATKALPEDGRCIWCARVDIDGLTSLVITEDQIV